MKNENIYFHFVRYLCLGTSRWHKKKWIFKAIGKDNEIFPLLDRDWKAIAPCFNWFSLLATCTAFMSGHCLNLLCYFVVIFTLYSDA